MSPAKMLCDECKDALTELVCDELSPEMRAKVEEHVRGCAECARSLSRMQRVMTATRDLPQEEPSPALRRAVMSHAREALQRNAASAKAVEETDLGGGGFRRLVDWLSRMAMAPQVAMAAVLLLVVGIGFYALPFGGSEPQAALEASAPYADAPAAPAGDAPAAAASAVVAPVQATDGEPALEEQAGPAPTDDAAERRAVDDAVLRSNRGDELAKRASKSAERYAAAPPPPISAQKAAVPARRAALKPKSAAKSGLEVGDPWESSTAGLGAASSAPAGSGAVKGGRAESEQKRAANVAADSDYAQAPMPAAQPMREKAEAEGAPATDAVEEGVRAAQSGRYDQAITLLSRALTEKSGDMQKARLWLARSYRLRGDCGSALRYYEPLLKSKDPSAQVLAEAADCYDRVGERGLATALRARSPRAKTSTSEPAKSVPATAAPRSNATSD